MKKIIGICLLVLAMFNNNVAGNPLDSLKYIIKSPNSDSIKIIAFTQLTFSYMNNPAEALGVISEMQHFSERIKTEKNRALCIRKIGILYHRLNYFDKALEYYIESAKVFNKLHDKEGMANCYNNIANAYASKGELTNDVSFYDKAIEYHLNCIKLRREFDTTQLSNSYNNIGISYMYKGEYDIAIEYYNKAYKIYASQKEGGGGIDMVTNNLGDVYLKMAMKEHKDEYFEKALGYFKNRLDIYKDQGPNDRHATVLMRIGQILCETGKCRDAMKFLKRSYDMSNQIRNKNDIMEVSMLLASAHERMGDLTSAMEYMRLYTKTKDSLINERNASSMAQMQALYETSQKDEAIEALKIANDLAKLKVNKQRTALFTMIGGIVFLLILGLVLFNRYNIKRKANLQLANAYQNIEIKNNQITDSINYARRIQTAILPPTDILKEKLNKPFVFYSPKDIVSGDFYWFTYHNGSSFVAVADCTGHGVPGALMSMIGNTLLNEIVNQKEVTDPARILKQLNKGVIKALRQSGVDLMEQDDGMDICICRIDDAAKNKLNYASANLSIFTCSNGTVTSLETDMFSVGGSVGSDSKTYTTHQVELKSNDMVVMSTDGYYDQFGGAKNSKFLISNFEKLISQSDFNSDTATEKLKSQLESWKGTKHQTDDVLVLGFMI